MDCTRQAVRRSAGTQYRTVSGESYCMMMKRLMKKLVSRLFYYGGLFHLVRFVNNVSGKRVTILTYHRVTDKPMNEIVASLPYVFTTVDTFRKQLMFIAKWYTIITFKELKEYSKRNAVPWNSLIITFDDGYADNFMHAYPVLREMNMRATYFITPGMMDAGSRLFWWDRLFYYFTQLEQQIDVEMQLDKMNASTADLYRQYKRNPSKLFAMLNTWDDRVIDNILNEIKDHFHIQHETASDSNSMIEWRHISAMEEIIDIGSHTLGHRNLTRIPDTDKETEIRASKKIIEDKTLKRIEALAYPCGQVDHDVKKRVENAGYAFAVTTEAGTNNLKDPYALRRINIWEESSGLEEGEFSKGLFAYKLVV
jgi:peptidoglycan/xylan/chitin deacetylase (PgdA/CDA1 family)